MRRIRYRLIFSLLTFTVLASIYSYMSETVNDELLNFAISIDQAFRISEQDGFDCGNQWLTKSPVSYPITIVTTFFHLNKSKHSNDDYRSWIRNFLGHVTTPMVIFSSLNRSWFDSIDSNAMRNKTRIFIRCDDVWSLPWLKRSVPRVWNETVPRESWRDAYSDQIRLDKNSWMHAPELYAIWNSRPWMADYVARSNPFRSKYFFSVDIGAFRELHNFRQWPSIYEVEKIFSKIEEKLLVSLITPPNRTAILSRPIAMGPSYPEFVEGGIFGGQRAAIGWWKKEYAKAHDLFYSRGFFVGQDQPTMNALFYAYADRLIAIEAYRVEYQPRCRDMWFYFEHVLAAESEGYVNCSRVPLVYV